ncbi:MAG: Hsp70 family protein [Planctomycetaceae bacterium]
MPVAALGIDLGTTHSVVAHLDIEGRPWTLLNSEGDLKTPSVVFFDTPSVVVGREALKIAEDEPECVARWVKRDMGRQLSRGRFAGRQFPPEVIQALVLRKLKADAELKLGTVDQAVITVPAYFDEPRRKATQDAGRLAGLAVLDIINEPTAAAICYGIQQQFLTAGGESRRKETVLVYDLGGGTFDATLMEIDGHRYRTLATAGDVYPGGIDWDQRLADYLAQQFAAKYGRDILSDAAALRHLLAEAEEAKHALTAREQTTVRVACGGDRMRISLTRDRFSELTSDLLERTRFTVRNVLRDARIQWGDVTRLLLVGGSSRMPAVHEMLERESGMPVDRSLSPDEAVAHGAAVYAGLLSRHASENIRGVSVRNVNSHDLGVIGVETASGRKRRQVMIPRNTSLPAEKFSRFETWQHNQPNVAVNIVEGGDAAGDNATPIGCCVVSDLPAGLPKGTPVVVTFRYAANGRLTVTAALPDVDQQASVVVEREAGLSDAEIEAWKERIVAGTLLETPGRIAASDRRGGDSVSARPDVAPSLPAAVTEKAAAAARVAAKTAPPSSADKRARPTKPDSTPTRVAERAKPPPIAAGDSTTRSTVPPPAALPNAQRTTKPGPETKAPQTPSRERSAPAMPMGAEALADPQPVESPPAAERLVGKQRRRKPAPVSPPVAAAAVNPPPLTPRLDDVPVSLSISESETAEEVPAVETEEFEDEPATAVSPQQVASVFAASLVLHLVVLLPLAFIWIAIEGPDPLLGILSSMPDPEPALKIDDITIEKPVEVDKKEMETQIVSDVLARKQDAFVDVDLDPPSAPALDPNAAGAAPAAPNGKYHGRSKGGRQALLTKYGGTKESEDAVRAGLEWLARHQKADGGWSFDHTFSQCDCKNPGAFKNTRMAATAMALLCFMGAGHTYSQGDFQERVAAGLAFLLKNGKRSREGGDFRGNYDGNAGMYAQGLVAIVLCEAVAMNEAERVAELKQSKSRSSSKSKPKISRKKRVQISRQLFAAAKGATYFIVNAQSSNGGWRYEPRVSADTSVVGWQIMALASAYSAKIRVHPRVVAAASAYLDSVGTYRGAQYGYTSNRSPKPSTTAIGLLCRIYMGWKRSNPGIQFGAERLSAVGPSRTNMYYNYYATQVMHQYGGKLWKKWNDVMRDQLVDSQVKGKVHSRGSWDPTDPHRRAGGRLYQTCLSVMTLEVYYRYLPLYDHRNVDKDADDEGFADRSKKPPRKKKRRRRR